MAGIGFVLKKLVRDNRYISDLKANLYSVILSSGPWIFAVLCIAGLSIFSTPYLDKEELYIFRATITYTYAFTLIFTSVFQLVLTRFISDRLFQREHSSLLPNFLGVMALSGFVNLVAASLFISGTNMNFIDKVLCVAMFCAVGYQWIILVFLSSLRDYIKVIIIYFFGFLFSFGAAMYIGRYLFLSGYLLGFTVGQVLIVVFLMDRLRKEFPFGQDGIFEFVRYFNRYPQLAWSAFLYNMGFWVDKFFMWYSPKGSTVAGTFHFYYPYDTSTFLAIFTIIPAMATFFLNSETDFYEGLRKYVHVILYKGTYDDIDKQRINLGTLMKSHLVNLIKVQFIMTFLAFLLAPQILSFLGFRSHELITIFRICLLASFFQVHLLIFTVLFWYLELLNESFYCVAIFFIINSLSNFYLMFFTNAPPGIGWLIASVVSVSTAGVILLYKMKRLNYVVFANNPILESQKLMPKFD